MTQNPGASYCKTPGRQVITGQTIILSGCTIESQDETVLTLDAATIAALTSTSATITTLIANSMDRTGGSLLIGHTDADSISLGRSGYPTLVTGSFEQNTAAGWASSVSRTVTRKNAIVDNTATSVLTFTCPNAAHGAVCRITILAQVDDQESVRCAEGMLVFSRVAGANLVGAAATLTLDQIATGGTETLTLAYSLASVSGGAAASNTMDLQVTLNTSAGAAGEVIVMAELINAEGSGITVAAA